MDNKEKLHNFLREHYYSEIQKVLTEEAPVIIVDFSLLDMFDPLIADQLLETPESVLKDFREAAMLFDSSIEKINIRVKNIPEKRKIRLRNLRAAHVGKFICTDIIVKSVTEIKPQIYEVIYSCPECNNKIPDVQEESTFIQRPSLFLF